MKTIYYLLPAIVLTLGAPAGAHAQDSSVTFADHALVFAYPAGAVPKLDVLSSTGLSVATTTVGSTTVINFAAGQREMIDTSLRLAGLQQTTRESFEVRDIDDPWDTNVGTHVIDVIKQKVDAAVVVWVPICIGSGPCIFSPPKGCGPAAYCVPPDWKVLPGWADPAPRLEKTTELDRGIDIFKLRDVFGAGNIFARTATSNE